jgi:hypothetical protein
MEREEVGVRIRRRKKRLEKVRERLRQGGEYMKIMNF